MTSCHRDEMRRLLHVSNYINEYTIRNMYIVWHNIPITSQSDGFTIVTKQMSLVVHYFCFRLPPDKTSVF